MSIAFTKTIRKAADILPTISAVVISTRKTQFVQSNKCQSCSEENVMLLTLL